MAKKKASAKKRTAAQKRATAKLVAMNKKKRASKKKAASRKKRATRATRSRRSSTTKVRGYPGGARRTNPSLPYTEEVMKYMVRTTEIDTGKYYWLGDGGDAKRNPKAATLFDSREGAKNAASHIEPAVFAPTYVVPIEVKYNKRQLEDVSG